MNENNNFGGTQPDPMPVSYTHLEGDREFMNLRTQKIYGDKLE